MLTAVSLNGQEMLYLITPFEVRYVGRDGSDWYIVGSPDKLGRYISSRNKNNRAKLYYSAFKGGKILWELKIR